MNLKSIVSKRPRKVDDVVCDLKTLVTELHVTASEQSKRAESLRAEAEAAQTESDRAARVASKVSDLLA